MSSACSSCGLGLGYRVAQHVAGCGVATAAVREHELSAATGAKDRFYDGAVVDFANLAPNRPTTEKSCQRS